MEATQGKYWLDKYPSHVPHEINPDAYTSLVDLFDQCSQRFNDKPAIKQFGTTLTYAELDAKSRDFAAYLQQVLHLKRGDRVAIMLPNILQYPVVMLGILRAGLVVVNVNPLFTVRELVAQLNDSGAIAIIVLSNFAHTVEGAISQTELEHVIVTNVGDLLPFPIRSLVNLAIKHIRRQVPPWWIPEAIAIKDVLRKGKDCKLEPVPLTGDDLAYLQYTGGTTGGVKGAVLTHRNIVANIEQSWAWVHPVLEEGKELFMTVLPLYHIFALMINLWVPLKLGTKNILVINPRDIKSLMRLFRKYPVTVTAGVNTLFNTLLHQPRFKRINFRHLKLVLAGGMALQESVAAKWQEVTGNTIIEGYGLSETSPVVAANPVTIKAYDGSIGLPVSSTEIAIRDEQRHDLQIGEVGELYVRGPQVMRGYWRQPEETRRVLSDDGWLATGDIAKIGEDGYIHLVDRKKDIIIVSGFNVYPNEVEDVLVSHPEVVEAGVISVPDPLSGEVVKAFVVTRDSALTAGDVLHYCRERLARYKVPKEIEFRKELPKSQVGKILRRELREQEIGQKY